MKQHRRDNPDQGHGDEWSGFELERKDRPVRVARVPRKNKAPKDNAAKENHCLQIPDRSGAVQPERQTRIARERSGQRGEAGQFQGLGLNEIAHVMSRSRCTQDNSKLAQVGMQNLILPDGCRPRFPNPAPNFPGKWRQARRPPMPALRQTKRPPASRRRFFPGPFSRHRGRSARAIAGARRL